MRSLPSVKSPAGRLVCLGLVSLVLTVATGSAAPLRVAGASRPDAAPQREILLNGLQVRSAQVPGDRVTVVCVVRAGAMFDPAGKSGLARMTAELLFAGAGSYTGERIREELDDAGATLTVNTTWDATWIEATAPPARLSVVLDVMSLALTAPRFAEADLNAAKKVFAARAVAELTDPAGAADRAAARALFGTHTYGRAIDGDPGTVSSIVVADVREFFERFYGANTTVLSIAGPGDPAEAVSLVRPRFGRFLKRSVVPATFLPPTPAASTRVYVVDRPAPPGVDVRIAMMAPGRSAPTMAATRALAVLIREALDARLGTADGLTVRYDARVLQSPFEVSFRVPTGDLAASIAGVGEAFAAVRATPPPVGGRVFGAEGGGAAATLARDGAAADFYAMQKLAADPASVRVTDEQLRAAAAALSPAMTVVVVGSASQISDALKDRFQVERLELP